MTPSIQSLGHGGLRAAIPTTGSRIIPHKGLLSSTCEFYGRALPDVRGRKTSGLLVSGSAHPSLGRVAPRLPSHGERQIVVDGFRGDPSHQHVFVRPSLNLAGGFGSRLLSQFHHVSLSHDGDSATPCGPKVANVH